MSWCWDIEDYRGMLYLGEVTCDRNLEVPSSAFGVTTVNQYTLSSVIHHTGTDAAGHYTASIIPQPRKVLVYDDSKSVKLVTRLERSTVYILFYRKVR